MVVSLRLKFRLFVLLGVFSLLGLLASQSLPAQEIMVRTPPQVVLRAGGGNAHTRIPAPAHGPMSRTPAQINVAYTGFSAQAQAAFQFAVNIWKQEITSPVPIAVSASWTTMGTNVLGTCGPSYLLANFPGAPIANALYPSALINRIVGYDYNTGASDINVQFNSAFPDWYYGTDGNTPSNKIDFVSVVLHELTHGMGTVDTFTYSGGQGSFGLGAPARPSLFDRFVVNGSGQQLVDTGLFANPSTALGSQLVSNNIYWSGAYAVAANGGVRPRLYAPVTWQGGSSIAHLNESTYPAGNPNSLNTPVLSYSESIHDLGPITRGMLRDLGWSLNTTAQTDLRIQPAGGSLTGDNVYNTLAGQTVRLSAAPSRTAVFTLTVQNDAGSADSFKVTGSAGAARWTVAYYTGASGGTDITGQVTGSGWVTSSLGEGATATLRVEVTPTTGVAPDAVLSLDITAASQAASSVTDTVRAETRYFPGTTRRLGVVFPAVDDYYRYHLSADGRFLAYWYEYDDLVAGDTNLQPDTFVTDLQNGITERVSVSSNGTEGNEYSAGPSISGEGRYVAFQSMASNFHLAGVDANDTSDVFVHDRQTGETTCISLDALGNTANNSSTGPILSTDGRYVAFNSMASNLVANDLSIGRDVFVYDRQTGAMTLESIASDGTQVNTGNSQTFVYDISADGRYVLFGTSITTLVADDTNNQFDFFLRDRQSGTTTRVNVSSTGEQANGDSKYASLSDDGRYLTFWSAATNLVPGDARASSGGIFLRDLQSGQTSWIATVNSAGSTISANGRYIAYSSLASTLVADDTNSAEDVFVYDRLTGLTTCTSLTDTGEQSNGQSCVPAISGDGRYVAFLSAATNLVSGDTDGAWNIFVVDRGPVLTGAALTAYPAATANINTNITLTAVPTGGIYVQYKFWAARQVGSTWSWTLLRDYGLDNTCTWRPTLPGTYLLRVHVREVGSPNAYDVLGSASYTVTSSALSAVTLGVNKTSPQPSNSLMTLTAIPTGGINVEYKFYAARQVGSSWSWTVLQNYGTAKTCSWIPAQAGYYWLRVLAREVGSPNTYDKAADLYFTVTQGLSSVSLNANRTSPQKVNTAITLTAAPTGGTNLEYKFYAARWNGSSWSWTVLQNYGPANTCPWTPAQIGSYWLRVLVREVGSPNTYDKAADLYYTINP